MINPTVETDLVGDIIEVARLDWRDGTSYRQILGRGRCRAVTAAQEGVMLLWLEVLDEESRSAWYEYGHLEIAIGDVLVVSTSQYDGRIVLRLIKDYSK